MTGVVAIGVIELLLAYQDFAKMLASAKDDTGEPTVLSF